MDQPLSFTTNNGVRIKEKYVGRWGNLRKSV